MKIIIGLGNPDEKYKYTRHNAGFITVDKLAERLGLVWQFNKKFNAETAKNNKLTLVKPQTYINNSGSAAATILFYFKLMPKTLGIFTPKDNNLSEILTVIHDDLDILLGKYKISIGSGSAGHNGVQSIIDRLKTKNFQRIRIGIRPKTMPPLSAEKFVLQKFNAEELIIINKIAEEIIKISGILPRSPGTGPI